MQAHPRLSPPPPPPKQQMLPCPLCRSQLTGLLHTTRDKTGHRDFHLCSVCDLVFVPGRFQIDEEAQKARYLDHNNDPQDGAYRGFLSILFEPLSPHLRPGASGLDYGAGPGPALAAMMREAGFDVRIYDPYFLSRRVRPRQDLRFHNVHRDRRALLNSQEGLRPASVYATPGAKIDRAQESRYICREAQGTGLPIHRRCRSRGRLDERPDLTPSEEW